MVVFCAFVVGSSSVVGLSRLLDYVLCGVGVGLRVGFCGVG